MPESSSSGDILTIRQLAEYLMVSEKTVYRMLERNQLPAVRVGAQWRFRRTDIDAWLDSEMRRARQEGVRAAAALDAAELAIGPLLEPENVWLGVALDKRDELLSFMASNAMLDPHVDRDQLFHSLVERERICSTALVERVAFPNLADPRAFRFSKKRLLLAVTLQPVDFHDPHGHRPRVVVATLARSIQGHLQALSRSIKLFSDPSLVDALIGATSVAKAIGLVLEAERLIESPPHGGQG